MNSLILRTATRFMLPVLLLFSIFLLLRGHNDPGGGFTGGLVAAAAFALYALGTDVASTRRALRAEPHAIIGAGLLLALSSGTYALLLGQPFLTDQWTDLHLPGMPSVEIGTPLFFDAGVYLVVLGVTLLIILSLAEE
jgi:multicomponent Na+:H+ antiporter subunit B